MIAIVSRFGAPADIARFQKRYLSGSRVKVARDPNGLVARRYGITDYPRFVALDSKGVRIARSSSLRGVLAQARFG